MFRGVVTKSTYETRDGFTFGDTEIRGAGEYAGHTLRVWYQNENIISWLDGEIFVTVPDLICLFDLDEKMPQLNPYAREGENVAVIARRLPMSGPPSAVWRFLAPASSDTTWTTLLTAER